MADTTNQNETTMSNDVKSEMPKIWKISHGAPGRGIEVNLINDVDQQLLLDNKYVGIGWPDEQDNLQRRNFLSIKSSDYFYLVRRRHIILLGKLTNDEPIVLDRSLKISDGNNELILTNPVMNGWVFRKFVSIELLGKPYSVRDLDFPQIQYAGMPSSNSTVQAVGIENLQAFESSVLLPVFRKNLSDLNITVTFDSKTNNLQQLARTKMSPLNQILYGPPGTGKTYDTVSKAMQIFNITNDDYLVLKKQFDDLKSEGRIEFVTFHQSFSYEDFVEGIRAETNPAGALSYSIKDGIFKKIAIEALYSKFEAEFSEEERSEFWEEVRDKTIDTDFNSSNYEHKKLILSACTLADFKNAKGKGKPYVLIIDEINRGNTSRVFGELITLVETTKRVGTNEAMDAILPYSQETFTVPDNLYIIGTMNTADRSLALMDTALRRRFDFIEMMPKPELIKDINIEGIDLELMLQIINDRIEALYDREHTIGHAFFMKLTSSSKVSDLALIFKNNILPLLEEYFFEDWEKITKVLGKSNIYIKKNFDNLGFDYPGTNYSRNDSALENKDTYINIYKLKDIDPDQAQSE